MLILVLVVILLLTYGVYGFTERMIAERRAAEAYGRSVQATAFAQSGIDLAASVVTSRASDPANPVSLYHRPDLFGGIILEESPTPSAIGRFSLVAPVEGDTSFQQVRFGLSDESGKLNLNAIASMELDEIQEATLLMYLPGMTEEIADAILDFIDEDETIRLYGAESEYYEGLSPPYSSKNGPLDSIDELLLVRGVTPELLYGEDANRNGLLDQAENDGPASPPFDDADGYLMPGWHSFLTIHSRESNSRADGSKKIHINQGLLDELYDLIVEELDDEEAARFIIAYRMYGSDDVEQQEASGGESETSGSQDGTEASTGSSGSRGGEQSGGSTSSGSMTAGEAESLDRAAGGLARALTGLQEGGAVTRGGLDLSKGAQVDVRSLYDLIDCQVDIPADEEAGTEAETITSPFLSSDLLTAYPYLYDNFALTESSFVEGRVNVNEARYETLLGLPLMTPDVVDALVAGRVGPSGQALSEAPERRTTAWLVAEGIVDVPTMRGLDRFLTGRGDVFKVQSVGFFDGGGPAARLEAVIDGTVVPAAIVSFRDLTDMGRGYSPSKLLPTGLQTSP